MKVRGLAVPAICVAVSVVAIGLGLLVRDASFGRAARVEARSLAEALNRKDEIAAVELRGERARCEALTVGLQRADAAAADARLAVTALASRPRDTGDGSCGLDERLRY